MKINTLLLHLALFIPAFAFSQQNEGIVLFEEKVNIHRTLPPDAEDMKAMIPEHRIHKSELLFNATESLYRNVEEDDDEPMGGEGGMVLRVQRPEATSYRNFKTQRKADYREFFGKNYLIEDTLVSANWKLTLETKEILDYNCMKATTTDTVRKREIVAWFADALPLAAGPAQFGQLPGMILEIDINNGETIIAAQKIDFKKLKKGDLTPPKKGEKITEAAFQKLVEERLRENGGRPMRIIRN
ncbi:MAG: GLPGLI family protein [Saprospiraceae bacterium]|nr:GLPGLI family protein [Saprospiraceae bacterium]